MIKSSLLFLATILTISNSVLIPHAYSDLILSGVSAYANKEYTENTLSKYAIDNNLNTWWQGDWWGSNERPQWLIIDLNKEYYVDSIELYFSLQNYIGAAGEPDIMYDIYTRNDISEWELIDERQYSIFHGIEQTSSGASSGMGILGQPDDYSDSLLIGRMVQQIKFDVVGGWEWAHLNEIKIDSQTAPVPEPSTIILLGTGLFGLVGVSRKKFVK